ncbi:MAG: PadR family transcriptional regulator [Candidatus Hodarchaeota archaeon]
MDIENELQKWETEFKKGFSKPLILLSLAEKPNYPYQVTKSIIGKTQGKITIAGSNIYPILNNLEKKLGLIVGEKDSKTSKRVYKLTEEGKEFLVSLKQIMKDFVEMIQKIIDVHDELT